MGAPNALTFSCLMPRRWKTAKLCLGFVGAGASRFCLKTVNIKDASGFATCGVQRHSVKFQPEPGTLYPRGNEICAYCSPAFPVELVPEGRYAEIITSKHSVAEWSLIFKDFADNITASSTNVRQGLKLDFDVEVQLKTPAKAQGSASALEGFLFYSPPGLGGLGDSVEDWKVDAETFGLPTSLVNFHKGTELFLQD